jgi:hypothetical protein
VLALSFDEVKYGFSPSAETDEGEVVTCLREMVAVARSNPHAITCTPLAAHAMHKFSVALTNPLDRCTVLDFLGEVEAWGWSTETTGSWLRAKWGR